MALLWLKLLLCGVVAVAMNADALKEHQRVPKEDTSMACFGFL